MKAEILTKEMREEGFIIAKDYNDFERMMRSMHHDKDYAISYWDKNNEECSLCLIAMNERDAEDRFNGEFPGNIFISAKEIQI